MMTSVFHISQDIVEDMLPFRVCVIFCNCFVKILTFATLYCGILIVGLSCHHAVWFEPCYVILKWLANTAYLYFYLSLIGQHL
jgi:hypothetical protein